MENNKVNTTGKKSRCKICRIGIVLIVVFIFFLLILNPILNWTAKGIIEDEIRKSPNGRSAKIGGLSYSLFGNNLSFEDIDITLGNNSKYSEKIINIKSSSLEFKGVNISSPESLIQIKRIEYKPSVPIEEYFDKRKFRSECYTINIDNLLVQSINFGSLVKEKFIQIDKISTSRFFFDVVIDKRLPVRKGDPPEMPAELLQSLGYKIGINRITAYGNVFHRAIHPYFDEYAKISFTNVKCEVDNLANFGDDKCFLNISSNLQDAGRLTVHLSIDLTQPKTMFNYFGQLEHMDAQKLNSHLAIEDKARITSGTIENITYDVSVIDSVASVSIKPVYHDLSIEIIDEKTLETFFANSVKLRKSNPVKDEEPVTGKVEYIRKRNDTFLDFVWQALLSGLGEVVGF